MENELMHYGKKRRSGRYPWGSGEEPYQHEGWFLNRVNELRSKGLSETEIAKYLGLSTTEYRKQKSLAREIERSVLRDKALALKAQGVSTSEIGRQLGKNESTIRSILDEERINRQKITESTVNVIKNEVDTYKYVDIGVGNAENMGITKTRFDTAVKSLENEGYKIYYLYTDNPGVPGKGVANKVLVAPDVTYKEAREHMADVRIINQKFVDPSSTELYKLKPVKSISSDKIMIRYGEDGGSNKDGIIELRRGIDDLSMGSAQYAQVRIGVDGTHYLKGVAVYTDDLPKGIDIRFNTNKFNTGNKLDALKPMELGEDGKIDLNNPFGATIKPGGQKGYLNIVNEEGDWANWRKSLSSQMLSKQSLPLAKQQLKIAEENKQREFDEIMSLENPTLKKHMLNQFASKCDTAAAHLDAAAMPRQETKLLLPVENIKSNEVYAPSYKNGETVVLIRYPHAGRFEIPELKVNNKNVEAKKYFQNATDAIGVHPSVAQKLSGADFDGDTVIVIPNNSRKIMSEPMLKDLQNFDPKKYQNKNLPEMSTKTRGTEMGKVSNLITDMTIRGASKEELARAVKHSMVVIDAKKHSLDYKQSAIDNGILELQQKYQSKPDTKKGYGGASTLISKANADVHVLERKLAYKPDPLTGALVYIPTGKTHINKSGKEVLNTTKTKAMYTVDDARKLSSGTAMENVYANYANNMKSLANKARLTALNTKEIAYSKDAAVKYAPEVASLKSKLSLAKQHAPYERKAQMVAKQVVASKREANPDKAMDNNTVKKWKVQALADARAKFSGSKPAVSFSSREWQAVQAGAIHKSTLQSLLQYADQDQVKSLALPKSSKMMTSSKISWAKSRLKLGYTQQEVAQQLGVSVSTLQKSLT